MIKRYNQFVKGVNEEFEMGEERPSPITKPAPTTTPDTPTRPRPTRPGITPTEVPSEEDAPLAYGYGENELPEEEGGEYMGQKMMADLASELGTEIGTDGSINYNGKKVNFYSETEMFHVDKKKFKTADEVINYLEGSAPDNKSMEEENDTMLARQEHSPSKEDMDELMAAHDDDDFIEEEEEFESKSYKRTFESYKRKK
jgi:hypothetical protein